MAKPPEISFGSFNPERKNNMLRLVDLGEIFAAVARGFGLKVEVSYIHEVRGAPIDPKTGDHTQELEWWRWGKRCIVVRIGEEEE